MPSLSPQTDDGALLVPGEHGTQVIYQGRNLYGTQPLESALRRLPEIPEENCAYILQSPLLWHGIGDFLARLPATSTVFAVEVDPVLTSLALGHIPPEIAGSPRFHFISAHPGKALEIPWRRSHKRVVTINQSSARSLAPAAWKAADEAIQSGFRQYWRNRSTSLHMGHLWHRNMIRNLCRLSTSNFASLSELPKSKNVLVCGAGPSLEKIRSLDLDRYWILAADTAVPSLRLLGVRPNAILLLESQIANAEDLLCGRTRRDPEPDFYIADITSNAAILSSLATARLIPVASRFDASPWWDEFSAAFPEIPVVPALGSVGILSLYLPLLLAARSISIIGLDFSWKAGSSHAKGAPSHQRRLRKSERLRSPLYFDLGANTERLARFWFTDAVLRSYAKSAEEVLRLASSRSIEIHDERGAALALDWSMGADHRVPSPLPEARSDSTAKLKFMRSLGEKLGKIGELVPRHLSSGNDATKEELLNLIESLDLFFSDFPDSDWPSLELHALTRVRAKVSALEALILRGLEDGQER